MAKIYHVVDWLFEVKMTLLDKDLYENVNFPFCHFGHTMNQLVNKIVLLMFLWNITLDYHDVLANVFKIKSINLNESFPSWSRTKRRNNLNLYFTLLCGASKPFVKVLKAFIKSFEAPQESMKKKFFHVTLNNVK